MNKENCLYSAALNMKNRKRHSLNTLKSSEYVQD